MSQVLPEIGDHKFVFVAGVWLEIEIHSVMGYRRMKLPCKSGAVGLESPLLEGPFTFFELKVRHNLSPTTTNPAVTYRTPSGPHHSGTTLMSLLIGQHSQVSRLVNTSVPQVVGCAVAVYFRS